MSDRGKIEALRYARYEGAAGGSQIEFDHVDGKQDNGARITRVFVGRDEIGHVAVTFGDDGETMISIVYRGDELDLADYFADHWDDSLTAVEEAYLYDEGPDPEGV